MNFPSTMFPKIETTKIYHEGECFFCLVKTAEVFDRKCVVLACGHTCCNDCVTRLYKLKNLNQYKIECAFCKQYSTFMFATSGSVKIRCKSIKIFSKSELALNDTDKIFIACNEKTAESLKIIMQNIEKNFNILNERVECKGNGNIFLLTYASITNCMATISEILACCSDNNIKIDIENRYFLKKLNDNVAIILQLRNMLLNNKVIFTLDYKYVDNNKQAIIKNLEKKTAKNKLATIKQIIFKNPAIIEEKFDYNGKKMSLLELIIDFQCMATFRFVLACCNDSYIKENHNCRELFISVLKIDHEINPAKYLFFRNIGVETNDNGESILHLLAQYRNYSFCNFIFMQKNIDITIQDKKGNTFLHTAVNKGRKDSGHHFFRYVLSGLQKNIDIQQLKECLSIQNIEGNTPLHLAAYFQDDRKFESLIEVGADITIINKKNLNALELAMKTFSIKQFQMLLDKLQTNTNTNIIRGKNLSGENILHKAIIFASESSEYDKYYRLIIYFVTTYNFEVCNFSIDLAKKYNLYDIETFLTSYTDNSHQQSGSSCTINTDEDYTPDAKKMKFS